MLGFRQLSPLSHDRRESSPASGAGNALGHSKPPRVPQTEDNGQPHWTTLAGRKAGDATAHEQQSRRGPRPGEELPGPPGSRWHRPGYGKRRDPCPPRPGRCRQDHHGRNPRRAAKPHERQRRGARRGPSPRRTRQAGQGVAGADRHRQPARRRCPRAHRGRLVTHVAGFYPCPRDPRDVIALTGLTEKKDQRTGTLPGGQVRRLDVARAVVGNPELVFLDEPTTG